jgi:hypothetical protein
MPLRNFPPQSTPDDRWAGDPSALCREEGEAMTPNKTAIDYVKEFRDVRCN